MITSPKLTAVKPLNSLTTAKLQQRLASRFRLEQRTSTALKLFANTLHNEEHPMLQDLTSTQVEQALKWLHSPLQIKPPQDLLDLNPVEWYLLEQLLGQIWLEQASSPLH